MKFKVNDYVCFLSVFIGQIKKTNKRNYLIKFFVSNIKSLIIRQNLVPKYNKKQKLYIIPFNSKHLSLFWSDVDQGRIFSLITDKFPLRSYNNDPTFFFIFLYVSRVKKKNTVFFVLNVCWIFLLLY